MDDERRRKIVKYMMGTHICLAGRRFFSGTAIDMNRRLTGRCGRKGNGRSHTHGSNQIVTAAVSDTGQGIIFGKEPDMDGTAATDGLESRRKSFRYAIVHRKARFFQHTAQISRCQDFVGPQLR